MENYFEYKCMSNKCLKCKKAYLYWPIDWGNKYRWEPYHVGCKENGKCKFEQNTEKLNPHKL